ncbi:uncharacterized protein ACRADG_011139 [Cochliomyia hominivorax]
MSHIPGVLNKLFDFIDENKLRYIEALKTAVSIQSVSAWPEKRGEIDRMVCWTECKLKELGVETTLEDVGKQILPNGKEIPFPKILLGTLGKDPDKKTVLIYGHLDVQPALREDGWDTDPFELIEKDGKLYGRGSTDDKGPILCWIHAIEAYQKLNIELPVNVKFVLEGMEESDSEGLDDLLKRVKNEFLHNVDYICISDNYWLGKTKPCLTYGLRGLTYFTIKIECAQKDLHSGVFGGTVHEAMPDLCWLLGILVDKDTNIIIPGIERDIAPLLHNEMEIYEKIDHVVEEFKNGIGAKCLPHKENKTQLLMHRWRYPSLSIHGIEGAFSESGAKTVIPAKVIGKFSIRLVPNQDPDHITECVTKYLNEKWAERGSPNKMTVNMISSAKPWFGDPNHPHFEAAKQAVKHVFNVEPDMTREGCSIPVTLTFQEVTGKNVILLPVGACDDGAHSQNEKINIYNYMEGTKLLGAYLYEDLHIPLIFTVLHFVHIYYLFKMDSLLSSLEQLFEFIDKNKKRYIDTLKTAVAIQSVSAWPEKREEINRMAQWTEEKLQKLGAETTLNDIGKQTLPSGEEIDLPKVLLAAIGKDPTKKTILVYGHLDVQPAFKDDGWNTEPFELTEKNNKLYGRGSTDDKGPLLCWIHAIEAYQKLNIDLPVNIKFVLEGMEENGSKGLKEYLLKIKENFLNNIDYVCISDNYWLGKTKPCLTYGLRGMIYYTVEVECAQKDLHSGVYGGTVHEAMPDLCWLLGTLVDTDTNILIPGIGRDVAPLQDNEFELYEHIDFNVEEYKKEIGANSLPHNENKTQLLMHRWRYPSLSIHGIEGAFSESGAKTVIPAKVIGKFSIRLVPNQDPVHVTECVVKYLKEKWAERGSINKMIVKELFSAKPWSEDPNHPHYTAARRAVKHVYNVEPDMTREGGSIPITLSLQEVTGKNVILVPVGAGDDGAHSQNEKINISNYIEGTKLLGAYMYEVGKLN